MSKKNRNWEWYGDKPKDTAPPDQLRPTPSKKNTRRWCKGKVGREHTLATVIQPHPWDRSKTCHKVPAGSWLSFYRDGWVCYHIIRCTTCGKIMKHFVPREECPTWIEKKHEPLELPHDGDADRR